MTPLGHAAVSYLLGRAVPRWPMAGFLLGGVLPDVDFLLLPLESFNELHRALTHNVFFVGGVALIGAMALPRRWNAGRIGFFAPAMIAGLLHLFIDSILDANATNGIGVAALWPLSDAMLSPFNLLDPSLMPDGWRKPGDIWHIAMIGMAWELPFYAAAAILLVRARLRAQPAA